MSKLLNQPLDNEKYVIYEAIPPYISIKYEINSSFIRISKNNLVAQ